MRRWLNAALRRPVMSGLLLRQQRPGCYPDQGRPAHRFPAGQHSTSNGTYHTKRSGCSRSQPSPVALDEPTAALERPDPRSADPLYLLRHLLVAEGTLG